MAVLLILYAWIKYETCEFDKMSSLVLFFKEGNMSSTSSMSCTQEMSAVLEVTQPPVARETCIPPWSTGWQWIMEVSGSCWMASISFPQFGILTTSWVMQTGNAEGLPSKSKLCLSNATNMFEGKLWLWRHSFYNFTTSQRVAVRCKWPKQSQGGFYLLVGL